MTFSQLVGNSNNNKITIKPTHKNIKSESVCAMVASQELGIA